MTPDLIIKAADTGELTCKFLPPTPNADLMLSITIGALWVMTAFAIYMMVRNERVSRFRRKLIEECSAEAKFLIHSEYKEQWELSHKWYESLPDYESMMHRFWVWPLSKFVPESCADYVNSRLVQPAPKEDTQPNEPTQS